MHGHDKDLKHVKQTATCARNMQVWPDDWMQAPEPWKLHWSRQWVRIHCLCSLLLPRSACPVTNPRILPSPPLAIDIREAPFLCGDSDRCLGADPAWCPSAPCNSPPARHSLWQHACRSARRRVAALLMHTDAHLCIARSCGRMPTWQAG